ncbi:hypothetical protein LIER_13891 [Lithospermum erythrorhizon]|uniref:Uncharacterized protein n=1 Tax=Lithospermum erythrorhizon TaxID=34254 RepID=A0AAV3Q1M9_LITER
MCPLVAAMLSSMSCALVASCSNVLGSIPCMMYYKSQCIPWMHMLMADDSESLSLHFKFRLLHRLMKSVTGSSFLYLVVVSSIMPTILFVLKKRPSIVACLNKVGYMLFGVSISIEVLELGWMIAFGHLQLVSAGGIGLNIEALGSSTSFRAALVALALFS